MTGCTGMAESYAGEGSDWTWGFYFYFLFFYCECDQTLEEAS